MTGRIWLPALFAAYLLAFSYQESAKLQDDIELTPTLPIALQQSQGYLRQLAAEMLYIKVAVFLGGRSFETPPESYAERLASHFDAMSTIHPKLLDIYFLAESSLSWISPAYAQRANIILERGLEHCPQKWEIPLFIGFNQFYHLNDFNQAAQSLKTASQVKGAPGWLGHLSAILSAKGGDILGGLAWLRAMRATEEDEQIRDYYQKDIYEFEKAARVLGAISEYQKLYGTSPASLSELVPNFISMLPKMEGGYELHYKQPDLRLLKEKH